MARYSLSDSFFLFLLSLNILNVICVPARDADLRNLFYSDAEGYPDSRNDRAALVHPVEVQGWYRHVSHPSFF